MPSPARSTYGPYNVLQFTGPDGKKLETFQYSEVRGSQVLVWVVDNSSKSINQAQTAEVDTCQFFVIAEISIWGKVQGYSSCLKRQATRMLTGPMLYSIASDEPWAEIEIRARNMSGGRRGTPTGGILQPAANQPSNQWPVGSAAPSLLRGYQINVMMAVQSCGVK